MNKRIPFSIVAVLVFTILSSCNNAAKQEPDTNLNECTKYACPVHHDNTSTTLGKCPKCDTTMVLLTDSMIKEGVKQFKQINK